MKTGDTAQRAIMLLCDYSLRYLGGAQTAFLRQARGLAEQGWAVVVVAPDADVLAEVPGIVPVPVRVAFTVPGVGLPVLASRRRLRVEIARLAAAHDVRALLVHSEFTLAVAALDIGTAQDRPVLHTVHTFFWQASRALDVLVPLARWEYHHITGRWPSPRYTGSTPINNALRSMTLTVATRADVVLSPSAHQARALHTVGVKAVRELSNIAEPLHPAPARAEGPLTLVWAARFAPEKRLDVALGALRIITARRGPGRVHLHVCGGTHPPQTDVTFHGRVAGERVGALVAASDAVLISSLGFDNQPMIALEAFSRGRPAVVVDPVLAEEFGAAAIGTAGVDAAGLAATLERLIDDRAALVAAAAAAITYARDRQPAPHAQRLDRLLAVARDRMRERTRQPAERRS
ncbi:glycosyltransferase [Microbacterium protaetiae]|uniref:D-inositol 3-phosphate glycosyltransferase n=1 Tax=Microbacterium protaetiae TaxID=2509458 RepID=A0A4P6EDQ1_9MICO|nr:glycosyltransferase family 4 protein [Microbacterium protaetiae]QAY60392.1 glycosyltransferase [Microbacterium protaetiae]